MGDDHYEHSCAVFGNILSDYDNTLSSDHVNSDYSIGIRLSPLSDGISSSTFYDFPKNISIQENCEYYRPLVSYSMSETSSDSGNKNDPKNFPMSNKGDGSSFKNRKKRSRALESERNISKKVKLIEKDNNETIWECDEYWNQNSIESSSEQSPTLTKAPTTRLQSKVAGNVGVAEDVPENAMLAEESRKRKGNKREENKVKRMRGEDYVGCRYKEGKFVQDVEKNAREFKSKTCSQHSNKLFCCTEFTETEREEIFNNFWQKMTWSGKKVYVNNNITISTCKRRKRRSKRQNVLTYYLKINEKRARVCKNMFLQTLGIKEWTVRWWLFPNSQSAQSCSVQICAEKREYVKQFFNSLPKLPSHYCRSNSNKLYLEPVIESKMHLYKLYERSAIELLKPVASITLFSTIFNEENLSLYKPKKDECDLCFGYKMGNISEETYSEHIEFKKAAREEKNCDKALAASGEIHLISADLQAVKLCPTMNASAAYYKSKLAVHNFTIYNLGTKEVVCYWFDETEADLKSSTFANFYCDYISSLLQESLKPAVVYTDGCTYQNRNVVLSNALLRLAIQFKTEITHKYLERGHTQMEVDSVHSVLERKLKNRLTFLPCQYAAVTQKARTTPFPYIAKHVDHTFFKEYSDTNHHIYKSIRPGTVSGDHVVVDLRVIRYDPNGQIEYKLSFKDPYKSMPGRRKRVWKKNDLKSYLE